MVFNIDLYKSLLMRMLGLRQKRPTIGKEVIINTPDYPQDAITLRQITADIDQYTQEHKLRDWPNPIKVFFHPGDDQAISHISERLEEVIEDLSNTRDKIILNELNTYPILATHAHTSLPQEMAERDNGTSGACRHLLLSAHAQIPPAPVSRPEGNRKGQQGHHRKNRNQIYIIYNKV